MKESAFSLWWAISLLAAGAQPAYAFQAGAVCSGLSNATKIHKLLHHKHLVVGLSTAVWTGTYHDSSKTGNDAWSGLDVDLIKDLARKLRFTYTFTAVAPPTGSETWDNVAINGANHVDLMANSWVQNTHRRSKLNQLMGFRDADELLVALVPQLVEPTQQERMLTFLAPFTTRLWLLILAICIISGCVLYAVEYNSKRSEDYAETSNHVQGTLVSIYLAFALFTGIGGHAPATRGGRVLSIILGFVFVVILAAYTANLAAFLTLAARPVLSVKSVGDLIATKRSACVLDIDGQKLLSAYPGLKMIKFHTAPEVMSNMRTGKCSALIIDKVSYDIWKTEYTNCDFEQVGQPLLRGSAGWITNKKSWCVEHAMNYGLQSLVDQGKVGTLLRMYDIPASCPAISSRDSGGKLDVDDLAGLLLLYAAAMGIVVGARFIRNLRQDASQELETGTRGGSELSEQPKEELHNIRAKLEAILSEMQNFPGCISTLETQATQRTPGRNSANVRAPIGADKEVLMRQLFKRYDLDQSGLIDNNEEFGQLCLNILHKLGLHGDPGAVDRLTSKSGYGVLNSANGLNFDAFRLWFEEHVSSMIVTSTDCRGINVAIRD